MNGAGGALRTLARLLGVQPEYVDWRGERRRSPDEAVVAVLQALGAELARPEDAAAAVRAERLRQWRERLPPVVLLQEEEPRKTARVRRPAAEAERPLPCSVVQEDGAERRFTADVRTRRTHGLGRERFVEQELQLPADVPAGWHTLRLGDEESTLLVAPAHAHAPDLDRERHFGVFLPVYAAWSEQSLGIGDLGDLEVALEQVARLGGGFVATLPFLAAFLDEPFDPSPYAPASRLYWNELHADLRRAPELEHAPAARRLLESSAVAAEVAALAREPLVDHRRALSLKQPVLAALADAFFAREGTSGERWRRFLERHPDAEDYARFRAAVARQGPWSRWPERMRDGRLQDGDFDDTERRRHLYAQLLCAEQVEVLHRRAAASGPGLYLDLPLGVHAEGYDPWRERDAFCSRASVGAPPDALFAGGQNWGFPPLHPRRTREQGHRYFARFVRHHVQNAGVLRIDHVMGLHRLYWIPPGFDAEQGVYVAYPAEELHAILALESRRSRCMVVGEDLGTVPKEVRRAMSRHRLLRMHVLPFEIRSGAEPEVTPVPALAAAMLNTHDMPPFAAFWSGDDLRQREQIGLLDAEGRREEEQQRAELRQALLRWLRRRGLLPAAEGGTEPDLEGVLRACLRFLGQSPAVLALVNLEDLWHETLPQNVPGTGPEQPNWRRKVRHPVDRLGELPQVVAALQALDRERRAVPRRSDRAGAFA